MTIHCAYTCGIQAHLFRLEADRTPGEPGLRMTGLPTTVIDQTVQVAGETLKHMGIDNPGTLIRCEREDPNAPPLDCGGYMRAADLPAVLAVLGAHGVIRPDRLERTVAAAALDPYRPDGRNTPCVAIYGATPIAERAERAGLDLIVPLDNGAAAAAECTRTIAAATADEVVDVLTGRREPGELPPSRRDDPADISRPWWGITDEGLRALEIACAGRHHMHVIGPPGRDSAPRYGRIAQRLLPDLDTEQARETTRIYSVSRLLPPRLPRMTRPPLRAPHYTASEIALTGDRRHPGEVSLAHNGLLLMDQPTEFSRSALADVARAARDGDVEFLPPAGGHVIRYPARFQLIVTSRHEEMERDRRRARALCELCAVEIRTTEDARAPRRTLVESAERVSAARRRLSRRPPPEATNTGFRLPDGPAKEVARTIAALDGSEVVSLEHIEEALALECAEVGQP